MAVALLGGGLAGTTLHAQPPGTTKPSGAGTTAGEDLPGAIGQALVQDSNNAQQTYWCPMRLDFCGLTDYDAPGRCGVCGMDLVTKEEWLKGQAERGARLASESGEWTLSPSGARSIYWCEDRGNPDHELADFSGPGTCPIDGKPLIHMARFVLPALYTCRTTECPKFQKPFYSDGICPECGIHVQTLAHMDHHPEHLGGQFFMASNGYHHLEGTMPVRGEFRLYFYDDAKEPIDARNFSGSVAVVPLPRDKNTPGSFPLAVRDPGDSFLVASVPSELPIALSITVLLAGEPHQFDFEFDELTFDPPAAPESRVAAFEAVNRIRGSMKALIDARDWDALHAPSIEARWYTSWLEGRIGEDDARAREVELALRAIRLGTNMMWSSARHGDSASIQIGYARFCEGLDAYGALIAAQSGDARPPG